MRKLSVAILVMLLGVLVARWVDSQSVRDDSKQKVYFPHTLPQQVYRVIGQKHLAILDVDMTTGEEDHTGDEFVVILCNRKGEIFEVIYHESLVFRFEFVEPKVSHGQWLLVPVPTEKTKRSQPSDRGLTL